MKRLLLITATIAILCSCSNEYFPSDDPIAGSNSTTAYAENGILHLPQNFLSMVDSILILPKIERQAWENELGFTSYNTASDKVYDELDRTDSWETYVSIVEANSSLLHFTQDSSVVHTINYEFYRAIANENSQFAIGRTTYLLKPDGIYLAESTNTKVTSFEDEQDHDHTLKCGRITNLNGVTPTGMYLCSNSCHSDGTKDVTETTVGIRRIKHSYRIYRLNLPAGSSVNSYRIEFNIRQEKKNWLGQWKSNNAIFHFEEFKGTHLSWDTQGVSAQVPNGLPWYSLEEFDFGSVYTGECSSYSWSWPAYVDESQYNSTGNPLAQLTEPWFDSFHITFGSSGVGYTAVTFSHDYPN